MNIRCLIGVLLLQLVIVRGQAQNMSEELLLQISNEGEDLYKMELLSWLASDYLVEQGKMKNLRGFVSYKSGKAYRCIFWNGAYDNLEVVHTFTSLDPEKNDQIQISNTPRRLTPLESSLYEAKMNAMLEIRGDPEFFTAPADVNLSLHFIVTNDKIKAYVFPGTGEENMIPLGNDYLLICSKSGQLISRTQLHGKYYEVRTDIEPDESGSIRTFHSTKGTLVPYITPTVVAGLLLYSDKKEIHEHSVVSDQFISVYNLKEKGLWITRNEGYKKN